LRTNAASRFKDDATWRVGGVRMQQVDERAGLIAQTGVFTRLIAVDIGLVHGLSFAISNAPIGHRSRLRRKVSPPSAQPTHNAQRSGKDHRNDEAVASIAHIPTSHGSRRCALRPTSS